MTRPPPGCRAEYFWFCAITPRWNDNDVFGHVNNVEYYGFFDTALMQFLVGAGVLAVIGGETGMVVAESGCTFHGEVVFTDHVWVGLRAAHIGNSSIRYEFGLFTNDADKASAEAHVVHVCVDRASKRPKPISGDHRAALGKLTRQ